MKFLEDSDKEKRIVRLTFSQLHGLFFLIIAQKVRKDDCYFGNVLKCGKECDIIQVLHNHGQATKSLGDDRKIIRFRMNNILQAAKVYYKLITSQED